MVQEIADTLRPIILDLSGVKYIDSHGLRVFGLLDKVARGRDVPIVAVVPPILQRVLDILGVPDGIRVADDLAQAHVITRGF